MDKPALKGNLWMQNTISQKKKKDLKSIDLFIFSNCLGEKNKLKPKPAEKKKEIINIRVEISEIEIKKKNRENQPKVFFFL